jgi:hypothetical protein
MVFLHEAERTPFALLSEAPEFHSSHHEHRWGGRPKRGGQLPERVGGIGWPKAMSCVGSAPAGRSSLLRTRSR